MSEFKHGTYTADDPSEQERNVLVEGLKNMEDWDDLKLLIEPCMQKIYDNCNGSRNNEFKMITWEFQQYIAKLILIIHPPCIRIENPDSISDLLRAKTTRAIEDATRRIEIKEFFRCDRYIRQEEEKRNGIK